MDDPSHLHHINEGVNIGGGNIDRIPQWSVQETRDFLMIRSELDSTFMETKRNKLLWEVISTKMKERGYFRSAEQCKSKWKNLVTRYKGCDQAMEQEGTMQQFQFFNELQAIFANRMQRLLWMEAEGVPSGSKKRGTRFSSDDDDEDSDAAKASGSCRSSKRKKKGVEGSSIQSINPENTMINNLKEVLEEFMKQQMEMEMELMKRYEAKEEERRMKETEWRQTMEALGKERMMLDERWREREEIRRTREEARAEKRDALVTELLNKLKSQD